MRDVLKRLIAAPVLPFALCFATLAFAESNHAAWVRAALDALPCYHEDRGDADKSAQLDLIATSIAEASREAPRPPREWAALLMTVGYHESAFSLRIQRGECKPHECDRGRARSAWQMHRNVFTEPVWEQLHGVEHTAVQVHAASAALKRAYFTCQKSGTHWLRATLNGYAGRRCGSEWPGLDQRAATFAQVIRTSAPKKAGQTSHEEPASERGDLALKSFEHARVSKLATKRSELGFRRTSPAQVFQPLTQRHVAAQRRQLTIQ